MIVNERLKDKISSMSVEELYCRLYVDSVTGAQNRVAFEDREPHDAVAIIDMDSLKYINDNLGHRTGDVYLHDLSKDLINEFGYDRVYRLSGDEFVVTGSNVDMLETRLSFLTNKNLTFSYGVGNNLTVADERLNKNKIIRERIGKRSARGMKPFWIIEAIK